MKNVDLLLINPPFHMRNGSGSIFPLGLGYLISSVEVKGYSWDIIDCTKMIDSFYYTNLMNFEKELLEELKKYSPLVVGIGPCITSQIKALEVISKCCKSVFTEIPVFAGGPLASIDGQEWLFFERLDIKYLVKGDGEEAVPNIIETLKKGKNIENSKCVSREGYCYKNLIDDIDKIQFPYRDLSINDKFSKRRTNKDNNTAAMITSRNCPYRCKYCVSGNLGASRVFRKRSTSNIIEEMELLKNKYNVNDIVFYDDCFFYNPQSVNEDVFSFCNSLLEKKLNVTWQIEMRPDLIINLNDNSINFLEKSGCRQINIGIEKTTRRGLDFLGKTVYEISKLKEANLHIKEISNIKLSATFILGGENETKKDVIDLIEESQKLGLDFAHYNPLFVYPGTPIYDKIYNDKSMWVDIILKDNLPWGEIVYESENLNRQDLLGLVDYAYNEFYKDTEYLKEQMILDRFNIKLSR